MARRRSIHLEGLRHGAPIPSGAVVGNLVFSSAISGRDGASDALRLAADTLREFAEAMQAFADGAADRSWSDEEVARLERESHDAIERILQTVEHARRHVGLRLPVKASMMAKAAAAAAAADTKRGAR